YGLYAIQHRGQESAGLASLIDGRIKTHLGMGLVNDVFDSTVIDRFKGALHAIGHTRYSTAGSSNIRNAQPITVDTWRGQMTIAHNGNLSNGVALRSQLEREGAIFQTTSDSEIILHLLADSRLSGNSANVIDAWLKALPMLEGAF